MSVSRFPYLLVLATLLWAACGGSSDSGPEDSAAPADEGPEPVTIVINPVGEEMSYEQTEITVAAGQEVTLVMENTATSIAMAHNIVVLSTNDDADANRVGLAGATAGEANSYVPEDDAILAYTAVAQPGETTEVTFTAPSEPGSYRYICTFPGHFAIMQGVMTVQ